MNQSKVNDVRFWKNWEDSGAVSNLINGVVYRVHSEAAVRRILAAADHSAKAQFAAGLVREGSY